MATYEIPLDKTYTLSGVKEKIVFDTIVCHYNRSIKTLPKMYKSYKRIDVVSAKDHSSFESGLVHIYKCKNENKYRMEMYKDGSFYPYSCIISFKLTNQ